MTSARTHLPDDWFPIGIPENVALGSHVYLDSSYGFAACMSERQPGITLGDFCGAYDRASFTVGPKGQVFVGAYTVLNGTYIICNESVRIGDNCLLSWGAVVTDSWLAPPTTLIQRRAAMRASIDNPRRPLPAAALSRPVNLEDNCWVGFDAVVLPGVTLGRGCIVGSKTVISEDVPPYAVVAGYPARIVRMLDADDTNEVRDKARKLSANK